MGKLMKACCFVHQYWMCITSMENLVEWSKSFFSVIWHTTLYCIDSNKNCLKLPFKDLGFTSGLQMTSVFRSEPVSYEAASKLFKNVKYILRFVWISVNHIHWFNDKGLVSNDVYPIPKFEVRMSNVQIIGLLKLWSDRITSICIIVTCTISNLCNIGWLHFSCTCFSKAK